MDAMHLSLSVLAIALAALAACCARYVWTLPAPRRAEPRPDAPRKVGHPIVTSSLLDEAARSGRTEVELPEEAEEAPDEDYADIGFGFRASFAPNFAAQEPEE